MLLNQIITGAVTAQVGGTFQMRSSAQRSYPDRPDSLIIQANLIYGSGGHANECLPRMRGFTSVSYQRAELAFATTNTLITQARRAAPWRPSNQAYQNPR
jgi:hypothetical protein